MTLKPFDLHSIRRNWERSAASLPVHSPDRLGFVEPPLDVYLAGRELLERLQRELRDTFPAHDAKIAPFRVRVERCYQELCACAAQGQPDDSSLEAQRAQLAAALRDLEDICEAFMKAPR